ncbi:MAG: hypothetical protein PVH50_07255 [Anaerolineae bacterium]
MTVTSFLVVVAVIWLAYGVGFALAPATLMSMYGIVLDSTGVLLARYLGAASLGLGLACWFGRRADARTLRGINVALFVTNAVGFIAAVLGMLSGVMNALGWGNVVLLLLMALGHAYFALVKPAAT